MKTKYILLTSLLFAIISTVMAQCPQAFDYQTVVRDAVGNAITNTTVNMRFTIIDNINPGIPVYTETQTPVTNQFGLIVLKIGEGQRVSGNLAGINWASGHKYMMVEVDVNGTGTYLNMGTEKWASVPTVLYADSARKGGYPKHYVGEYYGGGIVFYVTDNGQHGFIADSTDLQSETWAVVDTTLFNAKLQGTGGGSLNTERIIAIQGAGDYAAQLCANYSGGGYGDWFLPSINELTLLYGQKEALGSFTGSIYWSSTESSSTTASSINFSTGATSGVLKSASNSVRAVRIF